VCRTANGTALFLRSKEGVTQSNPASQASSQELKKAYPAVDPPWYADVAGAGAKFGQI
jgi:hypothetical protein